MKLHCINFTRKNHLSSLDPFVLNPARVTDDRRSDRFRLLQVSMNLKAGMHCISEVVDRATSMRVLCALPQNIDVPPFLPSC